MRQFQVIQIHTQAVPAFNLFATRIALLMSLVKTAAARPYIVSFACLSTSGTKKTIYSTTFTTTRTRKLTFLILKPNHHSNRPEDLLLHDTHVGLGIGEYGRFYKVAFCAMPLPTCAEHSAVGFPGGYVRHDALSKGEHWERRGNLRTTRTSY